MTMREGETETVTLTAKEAATVHAERRIDGRVPTVVVRCERKEARQTRPVRHYTITIGDTTVGVGLGGDEAQDAARLRATVLAEVQEPLPAHDSRSAKRNETR